MDEADLIEQLKDSLINEWGGFLRNTLRPSSLACEVCDAPVRDYPTCFKCGHVYQNTSLAADRVASMIYAVRGRQSGYVMRGYKGSPRVAEHLQIVGSLLWVGLSHRTCVSTLAGTPVTHWASVPSLPAKQQEHVLHRLIERNPYLEIPEIALAAATEITDARGFRPENFTVPDGVDSPGHVLLVDDTWVSGGHAESAAAALKRAGARQVSILNVARWLEPSNEVTAAFLPEHFDNRAYDPSICPWTGGDCP